MANVTVIPATIQRHTRLPADLHAKRKVAGYARVSTDNEEQLTSYEAQVDYYTRFIRSNPDWLFVDVYTDEGISGLNTAHREGFNRMIEDALAGKISLIVTKSVSRFARNTVDSLTTIRLLKEHGVEVYFEKEGIWTFDGKGEILLTIMSSLAQEESRSISENVTWGRRKQFADGKVSMAYKSFLGYRRGEDGRPVIVPEEAKTVRLIYRMFMSGKTANSIARHLTEQGIPTPRGKQKWQSSTVESILTNEKYKGDAVLQKTFTVDFLSKKMKPNEGEVPQYYVTDSHPAIIDRTEWKLVQEEMARRKARGSHHNSLRTFSSMIFCGDCGAQYGSKVWHSTDKYRRVIWQCNSKFSGGEKCRTPHLYETDIQRLFLSAISRFLSDRSALLEDCQLMHDALADTSALDAEISRLSEEMDTVAMLITRLINENASVAMSQEEYNRQYDAYAARFEKAQVKCEKLMAERQAAIAEANTIAQTMKEIASVQDLPIEFEEHLWFALVDQVTVFHDERIVFRFKTGQEITEQL